MWNPPPCILAGGIILNAGGEINTNLDGGTANFGYVPRSSDNRKKRNSSILRKSPSCFTPYWIWDQIRIVQMSRKHFELRGNP
jgi:hypothetical protein